MTPEGQLVKACLSFLQVHGVMAWRNNTGATRREYAGKARFVRFGKVGSGDIFGIFPGGRFLSVECKVGKNKPTKAQRAWAELVKEQGGLALTVWTVDDLWDGIRNA